MSIKEYSMGYYSVIEGRYPVTYDDTDETWRYWAKWNETTTKR